VVGGFHCPRVQVEVPVGDAELGAELGAEQVLGAEVELEPGPRAGSELEGLAPVRQLGSLLLAVAVLARIAAAREAPLVREPGRERVADASLAAAAAVAVGWQAAVLGAAVLEAAVLLVAAPLAAGEAVAGRAVVGSVVLLLP
jgi:hypothetical protein